MKYNIVLIPDSDEVNRALITLANQISIKKGLKPDYLLRDIEQLSIPHCSVIQFEIENDSWSPGMFGSENQAPLESIWKHISETWQDILANKQKCECHLSQTINYKHDKQGTFAGVSWSEIIIDKNKMENYWIQKFHDKLCEKLSSLKCLNASGKQYNPHFTLFNIPTVLLEQASLVINIPESYLSILKSFSLKPAIGMANNNWELTMKMKEEKSPELIQEYKSEFNPIYT